MACQYSRSCRSASADDSNRRTVIRAARDAAALVSIDVLYRNVGPGARHQNRMFSAIVTASTPTASTAGRLCQASCAWLGIGVRP